MKAHVKITLVFIAVTILITESILAKPEDRIRREFKKVEAYIEKIEALTRDNTNARVSEYIDIARENLEQARNILFPISRELTREEIREASRYLIEAKKSAQLASRIVMRKSFTKLKVQLDDLINQAQESASRINSDEAYYLLNQAKKFRQLAYDAYQSGNSARGQEYYRIAFFFARRCVHFNSKDADDIEIQVRELEKSIRQMLVRARDLLTYESSETLKRMLIEAEEKFEQALQLVDQGKFKTALKQMKIIERLLYRLFDQSERITSTSDQRLENKLYSLRSFLQALESDMENDSDKRTEVLLEKAWEVYKEAEESLEKGDYHQTEIKLRLCQRFANNIFQVNKKNQRIDSTVLNDQLNDTRQLLRLQLQQIEMNDNQILRMLYREANHLLDQAQTKIEQKEIETAFQLIQAATRISARIQRELKKPGGSNLNKQMLEEKYTRLQNMIIRMESNNELREQYSQILKQIHWFAQEGKKYLESGEYLLADEYFNTALEQIKLYTGRWKN